MARIKWTYEMLAAEALKYKTRGEFKKKSPIAYSSAHKRKFLDEICVHMEFQRTYWTDEMLAAEALKYKTRAEFSKKSNDAYMSSKRKKILDNICDHMDPSKTKLKWTNKIIELEALKYKTRADFQKKSNGAYNAAMRKKIIKDVCGHMESNPPSDNDAIYIWKAIGHSYNGEQVYKVGITSARLDEKRIIRVAKEAQMEADIIVLAKVTGKATDVEALLLELGTDPGYKGFNGASEFRAMTPAQIEEAICIVANHTEV